MKWTLLLILALSFLIDVEGAIANGKISLEHAIPDAWIETVKAWDGILLYCGNSLMGLLAALGLMRNRGGVGAATAALIAFMAVTLTLSPAISADLPSKAPALTNPFAGGYDLTHCGAYYGINVIGSTSSVSGTTVQPGTQVVQGGIGGTVGYGCPINATNGSFWFAEVMADVTNFNGSTSGLSLSGPASFTERFGVGSPLNSLIASLPGAANLNSPAVPNLPGLPAGISAGPGAPYAFVALHQQDVGLSDGLAQNKEFLLSYGVGIGVLYRLSNGVVADVSAEYKTATQTLCVGPLGNAGCAKIGQGAFLTTQFKY